MEFGLKQGWPYVTTKDSQESSPKNKGKGPVRLANPRFTGNRQLLDDQGEKIKGLEGEVQELQRQLNQYRNTTWYCCSKVAAELSQNLSIDTSQPSEDQHTLEVYMCVQRLLNTLDHYYGNMDGDQGRTEAALKEFQQAAGNLVVDGKLGQQKWRAMLYELGEMILGESTH